MVMNDCTDVGGLETWLRTEVVAAFDELRADPSQAIRADEMREHLAMLHEA
ncbi:hypothetical protein ACFWHT_07305 [Microbacterium sp. NPDC058342]|uniref:hypothetical protein n=1 Tax=Microbacterium sp. NPDC058342 TaxID=3346454 RepID=UPI00366590D0